MITRFIPFKNLDLAINVERGNGPTVILLHGFPDTVDTWNQTIKVLNNEGFNVIAFHMRGYTDSDIPIDQNYSIRQLVEDVLGVLNKLNIEIVSIVGHDWGASAAYALAVIAPERIRTIVTLANPPLSVFESNWRERVKRPHNLYLSYGNFSAYLLSRNNFQEVNRLYHLWSPHWDVPEEHLRTVKSALSKPERTNAAVRYYSSTLSKSDRRLFSHKISVPTLILFGTDEPNVRKKMFKRAHQAFNGTHEVVEIDNVGHWPHLEAPQTFHFLLISYLRRHLY